MEYNDLTQELKINFLEYQAAVNGDRALPDSKSGLKPVARRILFGAYDSGYTSNKSHTKSARLVGDVMGRLHPHGDSSIYGALVRLSQPWVMRYPLLDFHGNMGNIGGDGPAAMRYTNVRLTKLAEEGMLSGLKKHNVDFTPDYDEVGEEPVTLPAIFPNLLCNPNTGIGVAMACNFLPHNLNEVANAIYMVMEGEEPTLPGPDFPTGGLIINKNDLPNIIKKGRGSVKVRGQYKIEKQNIVFYEIPYGLTTENILTEVGELCEEEKITGIKSIRDESNKNGLRLVFECRNGYNPTEIVQSLFVKSSLQSSISYNQNALVDGVPKEIGLKECIEIYINHNIDCICREAEFDLDKAKNRFEIVNGLLKALEDIDNIIKLIKQSQNAADAKEQLIDKYNFSDRQAKAILDMKLAKLAHLEKIELEKEKSELDNTIQDLSTLLSNKDVQLQTLKERLSMIVKKYGDNRRTEIVQINETEDKTLIIPKDVVVVFNEDNTIKKVSKTSFKVQKRKTKGVTLSSVIKYTISTNTLDDLLIFTNKGKMYKLLVDKIPDGTQSSKGVDIRTLLKKKDGTSSLDQDEKIQAITSIEDNNNSSYVVFITKNGMVKKTALEEYTAIKKSAGIRAVKIKENDSLIDVLLMNEEDLILITEKGMSIHFETKTINSIGRDTAGVKGIKLNENDFVIAAIPVKEQYIAIICKEGKGKKINIDKFPLQGRAGKGVKCTTGVVAGACGIDDNDNLLLIGDISTLCISSGELPDLDRIAIGNILIKNSKINNIFKLKG